MTNERRHDKESGAGGHRKRTKLCVKRPRWIRDVSTALAEGQSDEDSDLRKSLHELKTRTR